MKTCKKCGEKKDIEKLAKNGGGKRKNICKECDNARCREYRKKVKRITTNWKRHKLNQSYFEYMFAKENGLCHICKMTEATHIDHDHGCCPGQTGCRSCVRGLLCTRCNTALYFVRDSKDQLRHMLKYLDRYESKKVKERQ
jgi:hypothetical protein